MAGWLLLCCRAQRPRWTARDSPVSTHRLPGNAGTPRAGAASNSPAGVPSSGDGARTPRLGCDTRGSGLADPAGGPVAGIECGAGPERHRSDPTGSTTPGLHTVHQDLVQQPAQQGVAGLVHRGSAADQPGRCTVLFYFTKVTNYHPAYFHDSIPLRELESAPLLQLTYSRLLSTAVKTTCHGYLSRYFEPWCGTCGS
jgi:hypothetical protein